MHATNGSTTMILTEERRLRMERMTRLARAYRGWNAAQLNQALGRDRTRSVPESGNPKLDLVARLAEALDWELGDVAERLWDAGTDDAGADRTQPFAELDARAQGEHRAGAFASMERTARAMQRCARTPRERAIAANRLAGAFDGEGRYARALESLREGLAQPNVGADIRMMLTVNLANANYTLWNLHEARSIAEGVLEHAAAEPPRTRLERVGAAFGHALVGHSLRRMLGRCESEDERRTLARRAVQELRAAEADYSRLFGEFDDPQYEGLAHTARGGLVEARVAAGELDAQAGLDAILCELDRFVDIEEVPSVQLVESAGWWSVFGANIAMRAGGPDAGGRTRAARIDDGAGDIAFAVCTNKAAEVGERLGHWPMRERAFTLEWFRQQMFGRTQPGGCAGWTLDIDDVRVLVGAMGRFPFFRPTGWAILDHATIAT